MRAGGPSPEKGEERAALPSRLPSHHHFRGQPAGLRPPAQQRLHDDLPTTAPWRIPGASLRPDPHHFPPPFPLPESSEVHISRVQVLLPAGLRRPLFLPALLRGGGGRRGGSVRGRGRAEGRFSGCRGHVKVSLLQAAASVLRGEPTSRAAGELRSSAATAAAAATAATVAAAAATEAAATPAAAATAAPTATAAATATETATATAATTATDVAATAVSAT